MTNRMVRVNLKTYLIWLHERRLPKIRQQFLQERD